MLPLTAKKENDKLNAFSALFDERWKEGISMQGLLVTNAFLRSAKFDELYAYLSDAAKDLGITLHHVTNAEIATAVYTQNFPAEFFDFVLFWDKDVLLAEALEGLGLFVFNSAKSILWCDDKSLTFRKLQTAGLPMPITIPAPKTFPGVGYPDLMFLQKIKEILGFPIVVKECFGSFGQQVYLCRTAEELEKLVIEKAGTPLLFQQAIQESYGRDIRVNIVGGQVIASILRESKNGDFRSNITLGGSMQNYTAAGEEARIALQAVKALALDFAGVDILFGRNGPLVCEVNSNAHFKTTLQATGVNMAEHIMRHIAESVKEKQ